MSLGMVPVTSATAENIFRKINGLLSKDGLEWSRLAFMGSDGANVMRGANNFVMTRMVEQQPSLLTIHCTRHIAQAAMNLHRKDAGKDQGMSVLELIPIAKKLETLPEDELKKILRILLLLSTWLSPSTLRYAH